MVRYRMDGSALHDSGSDSDNDDTSRLHSTEIVESEVHRDGGYDCKYAPQLSCSAAFASLAFVPIIGVMQSRDRPLTRRRLAFSRFSIPGLLAL